MIVEAAGRLFFAPGAARVSMDDLARELGISKKTIYRHFPDKRNLLAAVLDRQFAAVERTPVAAAADAEGKPFGVRVQRFLIAAGSELRAHYERFIAPYFTADGEADLAVGGTAITAVAAELGVPATVTAAEFYRTHPLHASSPATPAALRPS